MNIFLQNQSTLVTDDDVYKMALLIDQQVWHDFCPAWGLQPSHVRYLKKGASVPVGSAVIIVLDNADQAGDLGWHDEQNDLVFGRAFAQPVLANGGDVLSGAGSSPGLSVCSVASHEALEILGDQFCNGWMDSGNGTMSALEMCDPVEGDAYLITLGSTSTGRVTGTVSDFITPAWFNPQATTGPFDFLNLLTAPFAVRPTGYVVTMTDGTVSQTFGEHYPEWRKDTKKHQMARTARRRAESHRTVEGELRILGHHLGEHF